MRCRPPDSGSSIAALTFVDGRLPGMMSMAGSNDHRTFAQASAGEYYGKFAVTLVDATGNPSTTVVLWANFFGNIAGGNPSPLANQQATLVHEFIHASLKMGKDNDHSDIFRRFGIAIASNQSEGDAIQNWIQADCPTPPTGRRRGVRNR